MKTFCKPLITGFLAAALLWSTPVPAKAWLDGSPFSPSTTFIWHWQPVPLYQPTFNPDVVESQKSGRGKRTKRKRGSRASARPVAARTNFRPSAAVRKRNFARFVAKTRAVDPQGAVQLQQTLARGNLIAAIGKAMPYGLKTNDVADAMTIYLVEAWNGVQGRSDNPTRTQVLSVRRQIIAATARTPQFAAATDAQKQELAEAMLIQTALLGATVAATKSNPQMMVKVKAAIAQGAKRTFGLDLKQARLTDAGLIVSKANLRG